MREYGWSIDYTKSIGFDDLLRYYESAQKLQARDRLHELNISAYPKMKKDDRNKYFKSVRKLAEIVKDQPVLTAKEIGIALARKLSGSNRK